MAILKAGFARGRELGRVSLDRFDLGSVSEEGKMTRTQKRKEPEATPTSADASPGCEGKRGKKTKAKAGNLGESLSGDATTASPYEDW